MYVKEVRTEMYIYSSFGMRSKNKGNVICFGPLFRHMQRLRTYIMCNRASITYTLVIICK